MHFAIVVTGRPGAGTSTVGRLLAQRLEISLVDKDDILEDLFVRRLASVARRSELSQAADRISVERAGVLDKSLLVSPLAVT